MSIDVFISYHRESGTELALALERALVRFAKPLFHRRALKVFRDDAALGATPSLWKSIAEAIDSASFFVLIASPGAATSPWVEMEVTRWFKTGRAERLIIVRAEGEIVWRGEGFDPSLSTALPAVLLEKFTTEPRWLDATQIEPPLELSNQTFLELVAAVASSVRGVPKDMLVGEDLRQHRRLLRLRTWTIAALGLLVIGLAISLGYAQAQRGEALRQAEQAQQSEIRANQTAREARLSAVQAEREAWLSKRNEFAALAVMSKTASAQGRPIEGVKLALSAWPEGGHPTDPQLRTTIEALSQSLPKLTPHRVLRGHQSAVNDVRYFPDEKRIISAGEDGSVRIWDASDGSQLSLYRDHKRAIKTLSVSPDGRLIASGDADATVIIRDLESGEVTSLNIESTRLPEDSIRIFDYDNAKWILEGGSAVNSVKFSPNQKLLAIAGSSDAIFLWDIEAHEVAMTLVGHQFPVLALAFSSDGSLLVSGASDRTARVWDLASGNEISKIDIGPSRDGNYQSTQGVEYVNFLFSDLIILGDSGGKYNLWNAKTGKYVGEFPAPPDSSSVIAFSTSNTVIVGGKEDFLHILNPFGKTSRTLFGHRGKVRSVAFSPSGEKIVSGGSDGSLRIWPIETVSRIQMRSFTTNYIGGLSISPDGQKIAAFGNAGAWIWNINSGVEIGRVAGIPILHGVAFSKDGRRYATPEDGGVVVWDVSSNIRASQIANFATTSPAKRLALSPNGRRLAIVEGGPTVSLVDVTSGALIASLTGHTDWISEVLFSDSGELLATTSADGSAIVWDGYSGKMIYRLVSPTPWRKSTIRASRFSPNSKRFAMGSEDGNITIWDLTKGIPVSLQIDPGGWVRILEFSPDGSIIATSANDGKIRIWEAVSGKMVAELVAQEGNVVDMKFSKGGERLVSLYRGGEALIWDTSTGVAIKSLPILGGEMEVKSSLFLEDRIVVATTELNDTVLVWEQSETSVENAFTIACSRLPVHDFGVDDDPNQVIAGEPFSLSKNGCEKSSDRPLPWWLPPYGVEPLPPATIRELQRD